MSVLSGVSLKKIFELFFGTNETVPDTRLSASSGRPRSGVPLYVTYMLITLIDKERGTEKGERRRGNGEGGTEKGEWILGTKQVLGFLIGLRF